MLNDYVHVFKIGLMTSVRRPMLPGYDVLRGEEMDASRQNVTNARRTFRSALARRCSRNLPHSIPVAFLVTSFEISRGVVCFGDSLLFLACPSWQGFWENDGRMFDVRLLSRGSAWGFTTERRLESLVCSFCLVRNLHRRPSPRRRYVPF
mmetsp:Transcript_804/g.1924  ORF Transcript_804/g.1924 Transcript_804/m.1924 type:complete len:150 (-) Transcript_804:250-699(-)